ncbi:MAG: type VI secretion system baseplate subunit TssF [Phycisphaerae bacterium]|nr:type VI secretion system baseplate subunit TssF [Phycisphaerae bacterium]
MFNSYYQEELAFLRDLGREFAAANPAVAHMLEGGGADPDVERLLQGFAFLTGRIRQKLDDEIPELYQSLMLLLWPHYLRPIPSTAVVEFQPALEQVSQITAVPVGTEIESVPVDGTPCRFQTCYQVELAPLTIASAEIERPLTAPPRLRLRITTSGRTPIERLNLQRLRLFLSGEMVSAAGLLCHLLHDATHVEVSTAGGQRRERLPASSIRAVGFARDESMLPYPNHSFVGYRLLQEYFTCPQKFLFVDFTGLGCLASLAATDSFELTIPFRRPVDDAIRVGADSFKLHCSPVVNLFRHSADGLRVDHARAQYRLRPSTVGSLPEHYEIYSVDQVVGIVQGEAKRREYPPLQAFRRVGDDGAVYYTQRLVEAVVGEGTDTYLSFVNTEQRHVVPPTETITVALTCTNRGLPSRLKVGDIRVPGATTPEFVRFRNITPVTRAFPPPLGRGLQWRLVSHLSLNYLSLASVEALRGILELYNFQAFSDRQAARTNALRLEGIIEIRATPAERVWRGTVQRGTRIELTLDEDRFAGEGDLFLFASVLNEFFSLYATINSYSQLTVRGKQRGEVYAWPPRIGQQIIL